MVELHKEELHILYSSPNIIRQIKSRRLRWAGHVARRFSGSLFYEAFSVPRPYSVDVMVTSEWWWIDEDKHPCLKLNSNPRSHRPSNKSLLLIPRHALERREKCKIFWWESAKERDHSEDQIVDGRMGLKWIFGTLARECWVDLIDSGRDRWWDFVDAVTNNRAVAPGCYLAFD
jgi:hypothetical protein